MKRNPIQTHLLVLPLFAFIFCSLGVECVAQGINTPKNGSSSTKSYRAEPTGEGALTPEMIESCLLAKRDINTQYSAIKELETELDTMHDEIEEVKNQLEITKKAIDRLEELESQGVHTREELLTSQLEEPVELTDEYKRLLKEYSELLAPHNQLSEIISDYNERVNSLTAKIDESNDLLLKYDDLVKPFNQQQERFRQRCKDQPYYDDDYNKIVEKLGYGF